MADYYRYPPSRLRPATRQPSTWHYCRGPHPANERGLQTTTHFRLIERWPKPYRISSNRVKLQGLHPPGPIIPTGAAYGYYGAGVGLKLLIIQSSG